MKHSPSPLQVEAARLQRIKEAMSRCRLDLDRLLGLKDQDPDPLTTEIYSAAAKVGIALVEKNWVRRVRLILAERRAQVPHKTFLRIKEAAQDTEHTDLDAGIALEEAREYLPWANYDEGMIVDLATILFDYAITCQGLEKEPVRKPKAPESKVSKTLPSFSPIEVIEKKHGNQRFVLYIKKATFYCKRPYRPSDLWDKDIEKLTPACIYRMALAYMRRDTADISFDPQAERIRDQTTGHPRIHTAAQLGFAAWRLQVEIEAQGGDPSETPHRVPTAFCRSCMHPFSWGYVNPCCVEDKNEQQQEIKDLILKNYFDSDEGSDDDRKPHFGRLHPWRGATETRHAKYWIRREPQREGQTRYWVHIDQLWDPGIWQEVDNEEEAFQLSNRIWRGHEREQALVKPPSAETALQQRVIQQAESLGIKWMSDKQEKDYEEFRAQRSLGRSIRVLSTVVFGGLLLFTKSPIFGVLILVGWVMAYAFIDNHAIKKLNASKAQPALPEDASIDGTLH